jgi:hypothetical protein
LDDGGGYLIGWRAWKVRDVGLTAMDDLGLRHHIGVYRLASLRTNDRDIWVPLKTSRATCRAWKRCDDSPGEGCGCGVYAYRSLPHLLVSLSPSRDYDAIGEVALWGRVVVAERGYRAQFAYPLSILALGIDQGNFTTIRHELDEYGVPVSLKVYDDILRLAGL